MRVLAEIEVMHVSGGNAIDEIYVNMDGGGSSTGAAFSYSSPVGLSGAGEVGGIGAALVVPFAPAPAAGGSGSRNPYEYIP